MVSTVRSYRFVTLLASISLTGCGVLQHEASTPAPKAATVAKTQPAARAAPTTAPASAAVQKKGSGAYSVTFGIRARTSHLGAVQFDARAKGAGNWQGSGGAVACRNISGAAMMACNNKGGGMVSCALIDPKGIATPKDLVACRFISSKAVDAAEFTVKVTDASSPELNPVGVNVVVTRVAVD